MSAIDQIKAMVSLDDPFRDAPANLREIQLQALQERFAQKRQQIKIVDRRAADAGIEEINSLDDVVPLLFTHTNYKSYPETFIDKGQWKHLSLWLQTLTGEPAATVDVENAQDIDDWVASQAAAGNHLFASSGTSGKCSFLNQTNEDVELAKKAYVKSFLGQWGDITPNKDRTAFIFFPPEGVHRLCIHNHNFFTNYVTSPGDCHFISDAPLKAGPNIRAGQLRRALAAGTAMPEEVAAFEEENEARGKKMQADLADFMNKIYEARDKPLALGIMWPQAYQLVEELRSRGVKDGSMHPDTVLCMGGGIKGVTLPDDYREQIYTFFGLPENQYMNSYGMVEMTGLSPFNHSLGAYALPPWIVPLILDKSAEKLLNPADCKGVVEGRMALFDLLTDARWGGLISGDKVLVDFDSAGGYQGPLVRNVARYQDLEEGEDKLTCAGTVDGYVRGAIKL